MHRSAFGVVDNRVSKADQVVYEAYPVRSQGQKRRPGMARRVVEGSAGGAVIGGITSRVVHNRLRLRPIAIGAGGGAVLGMLPSVRVRRE